MTQPAAAGRKRPAQKQKTSRQQKPSKRAKVVAAANDAGVVKATSKPARQQKLQSPGKQPQQKPKLQSPAEKQPLKKQKLQSPAEKQPQQKQQLQSPAEKQPQKKQKLQSPVKKPQQKLQSPTEKPQQKLQSPTEKQLLKKKYSKGNNKKQQLVVAPAKQGGHCVLLSHLPSGLREPQLRRFVGQFGRVLRVRVPRSARTGAAKGVAFVELADCAAASVVAETLDNYLLFTRLLRCKVVSDPKRLTFAADGRRQRRIRPAAAAAATGAAAVGAGVAEADKKRRERQQRERASRLLAKVERLKRLDPGYEFVAQQ